MLSSVTFLVVPPLSENPGSAPVISTFYTEAASTYSTTPSEPFCPQTKIGAKYSKWQLLIKTPYKLTFSIQ